MLKQWSCRWSVSAITEVNLILILVTHVVTGGLFPETEMRRMRRLTRTVQQEHVWWGGQEEVGGFCKEEHLVTHRPGCPCLSLSFLLSFYSCWRFRHSRCLLLSNLCPAALNGTAVAGSVMICQVRLVWLYFNVLSPQLTFSGEVSQSRIFQNQSPGVR